MVQKTRKIESNEIETSARPVGVWKVMSVWSEDVILDEVTEREEKTLNSASKSRRISTIELISTNRSSGNELSEKESD